MVLCWKRVDWSLYLEAAGWSVDQCSYRGLLWWKQPQGIAVDFLGSNCSDPPLWPQPVSSEQNQRTDTMSFSWRMSGFTLRREFRREKIPMRFWDTLGKFLLPGGLEAFWYPKHTCTHTQEVEEVVGFCLDCCPHSPGLENSWVVPIMSHIVQKSTVVAVASLILCFVFLYYCSSLAVLAYACKGFKPFKKLRISVGADQSDAFQMKLSTQIILIFQ